MKYVKSLRELNRTDLPLAGGKGANLGELIQAGLLVPPGFCVTTAGYHAFVTANHLDVELRRILAAAQMDHPASLESASEQIRDIFRSGEIPPALADEIRQSYTNLNNSPIPVAIRSSATAEDLPDLSFAGQQDTYLNILGQEALLDAVRRCWASLWTARAIGYRARNNIAHDDVSLAVVVQQMVQSETSGVLFTANPLNGNRGETVIDATFGLGEALVSGQVEPDHYIVETAGGRILSKTLGAKALVIQSQNGGGTITVNQNVADRQALPDEQITALVQLGRQAVAHFGNPQDIEWAWAKGQMYLVQSRPITSLYPLPTNVAAEPLEIMFSFGVWQGMLDPYTPLGQDMMTGLIANLSSKFGVQLKATEQRVFLIAGERLFVNITGLLKQAIGRQFLEVFTSSIDPISGAILDNLLKELNWPASNNIGWRDKLRLARGLFPILRNVIFNLLWPARGRKRLEQKIEQVLASAQSYYMAAKDLAELVEIIEDTSTRQIKTLMPYLLPGVISGQAPLQILIRLAADIPGGPELAMELTRGLPHNVTTIMDLALWNTAQSIRAEANTAAYFIETDTPTLVSAFRSGHLPPTAQAAIARFLAVYGTRGVGEIDLGRPRWNDDPTHIFQVLKSYLRIDPVNSPEAAFRRGADKARLAQEQLTAAFRQNKGGGFKAYMVKVMGLRIRELGGLRETPKFAVVRLLGCMRAALLSAGQKLAAADKLTNADDVFYLHLPELKALGQGEARDWKSLIAARRATYERELRRKRSPRIMLSDGTAFYDAPTTPAAEDKNTLSGSPVSAGIVEGVARVVLDPHGIQLAPGEILVCPATDPAWTPLFLAAGGLVMEVGGMMTHGSVVAREYGLPAVVGVPQATERLKTGQRVRVDGSSGVITIMS